VTHVDVSPDEMRSIIEVIADTGKFWYKVFPYCLYFYDSWMNDMF
jgi:hypothetical protein